MSKELQPLKSQFVTDVTAIIQQAKQRVAIAVNSELTLLYWQVGQRINQEVLGGERADYGMQIIATLSKTLSAQFGRGWSKRNLAQMVKFSEVFADQNIVHALRAQLSWTHIRLLIAIDDSIKRDFYTTMAIQERWSTRTLEERIGALLFERTAISKKPDETIVAELTQLRESGQYNQNLLFYNRKLKRLVAIDLKMEKFKHSHKSQMELYLNWLKKYETEMDENPPLGIILCTSKKKEQIELLEMEGSDIHVAEYLTSLVSIELLEQRLHRSIEKAKQRLDYQD